MHPEMLHDIAVQAKQNGGDELKVPMETFENYLRITSYFLLVYAVVLLIHTLLSFQFLRMYNFLFQNEK